MNKNKSNLLFKDNLIFFKNNIKPLKARGENTEDKLSFLISKWEKIIDDCEKSNDISDYRKNYLTTHKEVIYFIRNSSELDISLIIDILKSWPSTSEQLNNPGTLDALCYLISELENILD